jgi:hypothetical protein
MKLRFRVGPRATTDARSGQSAFGDTRRLSEFQWTACRIRIVSLGSRYVSARSKGLVEVQEPGGAGCEAPGGGGMG